MDLEDLRLAVYESFAGTGRAPGLEDLQVRLAATSEQVDEGLRLLAVHRDLTLNRPAPQQAGARSSVVMAHPFSAVPLGFAVMGPATLWWGGCAWDSFALPNLLPGIGEVLVSTRCPACGRAHAWNVTDRQPPPGDQVAHFLVPAARMWDDVEYTCGHQRIFCSPTCVDAWLTRTGLSRGYVMNLDTLWRLAAHWYDGRLERGYARRDPAAAGDYLRGIGLNGPFWGT